MTLPPAENLRALLLDLDDTILVDSAGSAPAWEAAIACLCESDAALDAARLRASLHGVTDWFWNDPERERRGRLDLPKARLEILELALAPLGGADRALIEEAVRRYIARREQGYCLAPGALTALRRLRARFPCLALVTNGAALPQRAKIERFELTAYFDHIAVEGEVGIGKPEPAAYHAVLERLDARPQECLMVGDSYRNDVLGALEVGLHAAWIDPARRATPPTPAPRPHATVTSLSDLATRLL